ncbi:hypothetical protein [Stutzerimonas stutzeri]|uniref:hypothetical protein n=1 Tax=Stutzerimonas stutzeri TaxID=316 RepID=UPI00210BF53B|nr:hypothetical protein [Stutzerimonas stutzeri]MCQ4321727.1 hypothetical protein [Stutzerimonas stutzeri]
MDSLLNTKGRMFERADPRAVSQYVNQQVGAHCIQLPRTGSPQASLSHCTFGKLEFFCKLEQIHGRLSEPAAKARNITEIAMD